ncbi:MAG: PaaI family thioesterase [Pseudomonadota bacterium]
MTETALTPESANQSTRGHLPGTLGIELLRFDEGRAEARLEVSERHMAVNGYLHAGTVVSLADTAAGFGCMAYLPEGATSFTTIELKSNHLGTVRSGAIHCVADCLHGGRTTQVWESRVFAEESGKLLAKFTCTQLILYPR